MKWLVMILTLVVMPTAFPQVAQFKAVDEFIYPNGFTVPQVGAGGITPSVPTDFRTREIGSQLNINSVIVGRSSRPTDLSADGQRRQNELNGNTELMIAATAGEIDTVRALIAKGANVNAKNAFGSTALMGAAAGDHREVVQLLVENGASVNSTNRNGSTALMFAARNGYIEVVDFLASKGATLNTPDALGQTPLMYAVQGGQTEVAQFLLKKGADTKARTRDGQTALTLAQARGWKNVVLLLGGQ